MHFYLKNTISLLIILINSFLSFGQSSIHYKRKYNAIETRWAKEVNPSNALKEYPRPAMVRSNWINLNGLWNFAINPKNSDKPNLFNREILVPFPIESSLSGVKKVLQPNENLWYKRLFNKPSLKHGEKLLLNFGAVDWQATVYINGKKAGTHQGGYTEFSFDITSLVKKGKNEIIVKVYDPTDEGINPHGKQTLSPADIYYTSTSGIWQTVWLEKVPAIYVRKIKVTPNIDKNELNLSVLLNNKNPDIEIEATAYDKLKKVAVWHSTHNMKLSGVLEIQDAHLWSPDDPFLYDLIIKIKKGSQIIDEVKSYFGMRKIAVEKDEKGFDRIFLNNKYTYNLGTLDQGFWPDGLYTAPTDDALAFDIKAIKSMGFNTIRKHIKVEPARWYYHADKIGMLVWQDLVNPNQSLPTGSKSEFEKESKEILSQLHNYPSITTWVLFNEKWGQYDQKRLTRWIKEIDPSRIVNGHSGEFLYVNNQLRSPSLDAYINADLTDVHSYPYPMMSVKQVGKAQVCGEFGGIGVPIDGHIWDELRTGWGYDGIVTPRQMQVQFSGMIDSLKKLELQGLSASIYTQPFDVESEQNGIMTYDREVIKIPFKTISLLQSKIWPNTSNMANFSKTITASEAKLDIEDYQSKIKKFDSGLKDSAFLRNLVILEYNRKSTTRRTEIADAFVESLSSPFSEQNVKLITFLTNSTKGVAFKLAFNNMEKINNVLGKDEAESCLTAAIEHDEIIPYIKGKEVNWEEIQKRTVAKYGNLGEETVLQSKVLYSVNHDDWALFVESKKWFGDYGYKRKWITDFILNRIAWHVFLSSTDKQALTIALAMSSKAKEGGNPMNIDTYANLLYKLGNIKDALVWEEKAASKSDMVEIKKNYEKMKKHTSTW